MSNVAMAFVAVGAVFVFGGAYLIVKLCAIKNAMDEYEVPKAVPYGFIIILYVIAMLYVVASSNVALSQMLVAAGITAAIVVIMVFVKKRTERVAIVVIIVSIVLAYIGISLFFAGGGESSITFDGDYCGVCGGTGYLLSKECFSCKGTGYEFGREYSNAGMTAGIWGLLGVSSLFISVVTFLLDEV